jgi:23S rRNA (adenine2503-C2)-methyltransferase
VPEDPIGRNRVSVFDLTREELGRELTKKFHATQIYEAVYKQGIGDFSRITTLPKALRDQLDDRFDLRPPAIERSFEAGDRTRRHLVGLADGELAEAVFIPDRGRNTFCISSQVGCALACRFCLTGQMGLTRHLETGEIVGQVLALRRENIPDPRLRDHFNLVLMGMGEPLHNYENVMRALRILHDGAGLGMSMSRITLSTVGLIPEIERLGREDLIPNLAVSLTGATDSVRDRLMPINRTYPIRDLVECLRRFPLRARRRLTLEYVMLEGVTDSAGEARALARIAGSIPAMVNLIPLNESPDLPFRRPGREAILRFQSVLRASEVPSFVRRSRGDDISAACGQLKTHSAGVGIDLASLGIPSARAGGEIR